MTRAGGICEYCRLPQRLSIPCARAGGEADDAVRYAYLGRTRGCGTFQFGEGTVKAFQEFLRQSSNGLQVNSVFGEGANPRLRKIRDALRELGLPDDELLEHGSPRLVYGVLLFRPERHFLEARMELGHGRVQKFLGSEGHDWSRIESFKRAVDERLQTEWERIKTIGDLRTFIARRANQIQITPPRPMRVTDPEKDLDQLFAELVESEHRRQHTPKLRHYLSQSFTSAGLTKKLRMDVKVKVPVLDRQIEVPFGFLNGRFNLIQPAGFRAAEAVQVETTACRYAVEGRSLYKHADPQLGKLQLVVVGMFGQEETATKARVKRIVDDNKVRLFATIELDQLIEEIRETAKDLPSNRASSGKGHK